MVLLDPAIGVRSAAGYKRADVRVRDMAERLNHSARGEVAHFRARAAGAGPRLKLRRMSCDRRW